MIRYVAYCLDCSWRFRSGPLGGRDLLVGRAARHEAQTMHDVRVMPRRRARRGMRWLWP